MTTTSLTSSSAQETIDQFIWTYQERSFTLTYTRLGQGNPVLLLPAFSTVSSRTELTQIAQSLSSNYQVTILDWLGFGDSERPNLDYQPALYQQLLTDFVTNCFEQPIILIASGHASGYALKLAQSHPLIVDKIALIAPTWRGPLRVMGVSKNVRRAVKKLVDLPIIGQFLYFLNTTPSFLHFMYRRHVYVDQTKLTPDFITRKRQITQHPGGRFAPVAFVTGLIDPFNERSDILSLIDTLSQPILVIIGQQSPPYSKIEMEAIAQLPKINEVKLSGTLGMYEECAESVTQAIENFI